MNDSSPLLIDIGPLSCCSTDHVLDVMHKALGEDEHDIWLPHESPFIRDLIERWTAHGLDRFGTLQNELGKWINHEHYKPAAAIPPRPGSFVRWDKAELAMARHYLESVPPESFTLDDWMMVVDYLVQRYLPQDELFDEAKWNVTRSSMAGRMQHLMPDMAAAAVAAIAAKLPENVLSIQKLFGLSAPQAAAIEFGQARCCQYVTNVTESARSKMKLSVVEWQKEKFEGAPSALARRNLEGRLLDDFGTLNKDWRRLSITEAGESANQGFVAATPTGDKLKRIEMYKGACAYCRSIDGAVVTVVEASKRDKNWNTEIWPGKDNYLRSASPYKRVGGQLVKRTEAERWSIPAGLSHPHCFIDPAVPVYTSEGWRPIGDIKIGDQVLTHKGHFRAVNWVLEPIPYSGKVISLQATFNGRNNAPIPAMTPEHPVLTERGWVNAGEIAVGDKIVAMAKKCPTCNTSFVNMKFDSVEYCCKQCVPKSGVNQFSTDDKEVYAREVERTRQANTQRMRGLTIEQRQSLTSKARAAAAAKGYDWLKDAGHKGAVALGSMNYKASDTELQIINELHGIGINASPQFRVENGKFDIRGQRRYWWLDIALPEQKIAIEIDGEPWHGRLAEAGRDDARDSNLTSLGWTVLRFKHAVAKSNPSAIAQEIARIAMNHSGEYSFASIDVSKVTAHNVRDRKLYNFGVDEDESYIIRGGVVVHNCRGQWVTMYQAKPGDDPKFAAWLEKEFERK